MRKLLLTQGEKFESSLFAKDLQIPEIQINNLFINVISKNKKAFQLQFRYISEGKSAIRYSHHFASIFEKGDIQVIPKEDIDFKVKRVEIILNSIDGKPELEFNVYADFSSSNK